MFENQFSPVEILQKLRTACSVRVLVELGIGCVGITSVVFGWWHVMSASNQDIRCFFPQENSDEIFNPIVVSVAGAVKNPGIVSLKPGSRLSQAIEAVGGYAGDVDTAFLNRELNLSSVVSDQEQIFIPFSSSIKDEVPSGEANSALISINTASASDLESLPGIGEKRAEEIIANRPYQQLVELTDKDIISDTLFR